MTEPTVIEPSFSNKADAQCIRVLLAQGNIKLAWYTYLEFATKIKEPPDKNLLITLLAEIDAAAMRLLDLDPIDPETVVEMSEETLTFRTSNALENALENALSRFANRIPRTDTYVLDVHGRRTLRLYNSYGEPAPRSKTINELGKIQPPNLCAVHIPHPALPA